MKSEILVSVLNSKPLNEIKHCINQNKKEVFVSQLAGSSKSLVAISLFKEIRKSVLFFSSVQELSETKVELSLLGYEKQLIVFESLAKEDLQEKLTDLSGREEFIV